MRFSFKCHVVAHVSGRVTVTPIDLPGLAVHAEDLPRAIEELTLALDDRLSRAHPRRLFDLARPGEGEPLTLSVPGITVRGAAVAPLKIYALRAPAHRPYHEVRAPRLGSRVWVAGKDVAAQATTLLEAELEGRGEAERLALRAEAPESYVDLVIDVQPSRLSDLSRRELDLDERAPKRAAVGDEDDDAAAEPEHDDWFDDRRRRRKRPAAARKPRRPPTPTLDRLGTPWHKLAAEDALDPAYERDELVARLRARLDVEDPEPLVLVGPSGAGKTAVLQELARRLAAEEARKPEADRDPRPLVFVDGSRLIAGQGGYGDWQAQVLESFAEARAARAVLVLGRVIDLLDAGKSAHSEQNVADLIAPALAAREIAVLAEATPEEWAQVERRKQALARGFSVLRVEDLEGEAVARMLARVGAELAAERELAVAPAAVSEVLALCRRFMPYGALTGNAVALLRRVVERAAQLMARKVAAADARALFSTESGIPLRLLDDAVPLPEREVRAFLAARVHGQEAAVARVAAVVSVIKANLADRRRPTAVLLFAGPTGVGKTELAKALCELVFGSRERMVRLDMGEYAGPDALARLCGDGAASGHLTSAVRRQPFSVVLLDEIEKAHPAVFDALLGVLGEGRLTDVAGRLTDFRSTVIVLTSNLGADTLRARPGFGGAALAPELERHYRAAAQGFFRPELWNRLDDVVVFAALGAPEIRRIVDRELERIAARDGLRHHDLALEVDAAARDRLAARGLDPRYGARPLKRTLERELVAPVASWLASHPARGATRLTATVEAERVRLDAASLGGGEEGVSRKEIERILDRAAALRAEVRRWARSRPMARLRQELALFDRQSRLPSFWHDRQVADERARAAAEGRELDAAFAATERQVETAEDLAFEAYHARQVAAARSLGEDLDDVERQLAALGERLYATLFPPRNTVSLLLSTSRGGWSSLCLLADALGAWLRPRGGSAAWQQPIELAPPPPPEGQKRSKKNPPRTTYQWKPLVPEPHGAPSPCVALLSLSGVRAQTLLAAEHGAHRFVAGGTTHVVKLRFEPGAAAELQAPALLETLDERQPKDEIRRVWPDKRIVEDLRLEKKFELGSDGGIDLEPILVAYRRWRVFGAEGVEDP